MSIAVKFPRTCETFCCDRRINESVILEQMPRKGVISNPSISHANSHCPTSCTTSLLAAGGYFLLHFTFFLYLSHLKRIVKAMAQVPLELRPALMTMSHILVGSTQGFRWRGQYKGLIQPLRSITKGQRHLTTGGRTNKLRASDFEKFG